jgi:aspartyl protease family protein
MSAPVPSESAAARFGRRLLILCALLALALFILVSFFPSSRWDDYDGPYALRYGLILIFVALGLAASRRRLSVMAAELGLWLIIMLGLVAGYSYRYELQDLALGVKAQLLPSSGTERSPGVVSFNRAADGQFWIEAKVDGVSIRFLVDTGATDVVLSSADAARLGYDPDRLTFSREADTANGRTREAPITIGRLSIGSIHFEHVPAAVTAGGLRSSLLGMGLLERLSGVEIRRDTLTIRE